MVESTRTSMTRESNPTVLLADDQTDVREALRLLLKSEGIASVGMDGPAGGAGGRAPCATSIAR